MWLLVFASWFMRLLRCSVEEPKKLMAQFGRGMSTSNPQSIRIRVGYKIQNTD